MGETCIGNRVGRKGGRKEEVSVVRLVSASLAACARKGPGAEREREAHLLT